MPQTATSQEVSKSFGRFGRQALEAPLTITHHGRDSLVLLSHAEYQRLKRRDREAMTIDQAPQDVRDAVAAARWGQPARAASDEGGA